MAMGAVGIVHQVGQRQLVLGGELVQVDGVLEHVGVERALGQREVGLDVVVELDQLDLVALLFQDGLDAQLDLVVVGAGAGADDQFFRVLGGGGAGGQGQGQGGEQQGAAGELPFALIMDSR